MSRDHVTAAEASPAASAGPLLRVAGWRPASGNKTVDFDRPLEDQIEPRLSAFTRRSGRGADTSKSGPEARRETEPSQSQSAFSADRGLPRVAARDPFPASRDKV